MPLSRQSLLPLAIALLIVSSLLPAGPARWVSKVPVDMLGMALNPVRRPLHQLSVSIRGEQKEPRERPAEGLAAENDRLRVMLERKSIELARAQQVIADLRGLRKQLHLTGFNPLEADTVAARYESGHPTITLNIGKADNVAEGQVVASGVDLVGRVARAQMMSCEVRLITEPGPPLQVRLVPRDLGDPRRIGALLVRYDVRRAAFIAEVSVIGGSAVKVGDDAMLDDPQWPTGQGLVVGTVTALTPLPDDPSRRATLVIQPRKDLLRLHGAIVIVPNEGEN